MRSLISPTEDHGDSTLDVSVEMFWEARATQGELLPAPSTRNVLDPGFIETHLTRTFGLPDGADTVRARVKIRPIDFEVLESLVASGDLSETVAKEMPTFILERSELEWRASDGMSCVPADP